MQTLSITLFQLSVEILPGKALFLFSLTGILTIIMVPVALVVIALIALMKRRQARRRLESSLSTHGLTLEAPLLQYTCRPSLTCGAEPYTSSPHHISISVLPAAKLHGTFPVSRLASSQVYRVLTSFAFRSFQVFNPKHVQHA